MRKLFLVCALALFGIGQSFAGSEYDEDADNLFNHLSIGVSVGSDGIGFDLASPIGNMFAVRAGMSIWPRLTYKTDVDPGTDSKSFILNKDGKIDLEGKVTLADFKLLFDFYPFKNSPFRVTAGAFIGSQKVVSVYNSGQFLERNEWGKVGIQHGDYKIASDKDGNINLDVKTNGFKPYLGVGYGRTIPHKSIGVAVDLGVQFWGTPAIYTNVMDDFGDLSYKKLTEQDKGNKDLNDAIDKLSKIVVLPVLSIRLCGRIL